MRVDRAWVRRAINLVLLLLVTAGIGLGVRFLTTRGNGEAALAAAPPNRQPQAVPILAVEAQAKDFPIIVRGLGTVEAFNTVTVKSRVDGNIEKIGYQEGQYVRKGDLLVQIDPRPYQAQLKQAEANKAKDQANLENAQRDLARYAALLKSDLAVTQQQYQTQQATVAQLQASLQADQAQIDAARLNVAYCSITSPIDGITGLRLVDIGNLVQASAATPLVVVTQIKPIYVTFTIPERDLDRVRQAMTQHPLTVLAFNGDDTHQLSEGKLNVVNNTVDHSTGTVTLKAEFANQDAALWPGEFVNAHLQLKVAKNGVTLPVSAVLMGPTGSFVYLIQPDSTVKVQPVTITEVENGTALMGQGLAAGDKVVATGQTGLAPGAKVAVKPGAVGEMDAREPEIGPEGVGSTGITTGPSGAGGITPR
ncbi:MAG: efflux RND transporter periplasmic adaptor subunit [Alphaproteobacteria bacterium]|nr:efflux RND transporter periplasmic adaptor subunit [Alphaproteobacteria bacterium]